MSQTFLLEPDIIAATENVMPDLNTDLVLAKNFLKQQSAATGDSLYDHLVDIVQKILSQKPPDVVDNFEQYSWEVKQEKFRPNFDLLNDIYMSPPQLSVIRKMDDMFRTRALSPQYGESDAIRFLIGTQSLKQQSNQIHVVELEEDTGALHTKVFKHDVGEVWHLRCSPHDAAVLLTTHNAYDVTTCQCTMGVSVYKLPTTEVIPKDSDDLSAIQGRNAEDMELLKTITPEKPEEEIRCSEWHPTDPSKIGVVYENNLRVHDVTTGAALTAAGESRARLKLTSGKWSPHQAHTQFAVLQDMHIKCYDTRTDCTKPSWTIDNAHRQLVRDLDFNPNRQFHMASAGDDAALNIWDYRNGKEPIFSRTDHSHWVWTVRYNTYHEQLLLTGSSDARALLTAATSICDVDDDGKRLSQVLEDGVLQSYEQHEDSVYCVEWSAAEPWTFASLSYDARLVLSTVPRHFNNMLRLFCLGIDI